jgi:hypothetical protein
MLLHAETHTTSLEETSQPFINSTQACVCDPCLCYYSTAAATPQSTASLATMERKEEAWQWLSVSGQKKKDGQTTGLDDG